MRTAGKQKAENTAGPTDWTAAGRFIAILPGEKTTSSLATHSPDILRDTSLALVAHALRLLALHRGGGRPSLVPPTGNAPKQAPLRQWLIAQ
jgi:hypothetical protein